MKITLIYSDNNFKEQVEKLAKQYNLSIDSFKDKSPKAYKIKAHYGTKLSPFCVIMQNELEVPFYSDNNDCTIENIKEIINRYA